MRDEFFPDPEWDRELLSRFLVFMNVLVLFSCLHITGIPCSRTHGNRKCFPGKHGAGSIRLPPVGVHAKGALPALDQDLLQHLRSFAGITGPALTVFPVPGDRFRAGP